MLFDDISDSFTGVGKTYTLTTSSLNTTGVGIGGILFINGVFKLHQHLIMLVITMSLNKIL